MYMKIALVTTIFSLLHIGVYMLVRMTNLIPQDFNVHALWVALSITFTLSLLAIVAQGIDDIR